MTICERLPPKQGVNDFSKYHIGAEAQCEFKVNVAKSQTTAAERLQRRRPVACLEQVYALRAPPNSPRRRLVNGLKIAESDGDEVLGNSDENVLRLIVCEVPCPERMRMRAWHVENLIGLISLLLQLRLDAPAQPIRQRDQARAEEQDAAWFRGRGTTIGVAEKVCPVRAWLWLGRGIVGALGL